MYHREVDFIEDIKKCIYKGDAAVFEGGDKWKSLGVLKLAG